MVSRKRCHVVLGVMSLVGMAAGFVVAFMMDSIYHKILLQNLSMEPGGQVYDVWQNPPIASYMHIHVYNYTNPQGFLNGQKPRVNELGPYVFRNYRINKVVNSKPDTITYLQDYSYVFDQERSCNRCRRDDVIYTPSLAAVVMLSQIQSSKIEKDSWKYSAAMLLANKFFTAEGMVVFNKVTVHQMLWGYDDPFLKKFYDMESMVKPFLNMLGIKIPPFTPFVNMQRNGTAEAEFIGNITINRGAKDMDKVLQVKSWKNKDRISCWKGYGQMINGTDGTRYSPDFKRNQRIYMFMADAYRSVHFDYEKDVDFYGITLYRHTTPLSLFANATVNPDNRDFCTDRCYETGVAHVGHCSDIGSAPLFMTWPHFYQADPSLVDAIDGLKPPVKERDAMFLNVEPQTGMTMQAIIRLQIAFLLEIPPKVKLVEKVSTKKIYLPAFYFSEVGGLDEAYATMLRDKVLALRIKLKIGAFSMAGVITLVFLVNLVLFTIWWRANKKQVPYNTM